MSASTATSRKPAAVARTPWNPDRVGGSSATIRPFILSSPETPPPDITSDFVLPSVIAERSAEAERHGFDRGFASGERAGLDAVKVRTDGQLARLTSSIEDLRALRLSVLKKSEQDIVRLAVAIAERVLHREVRAEPQILVSMARAAAQKLGDTNIATILINPDDFAAMASSLPAQVEADAVRVVADANVPPGGCTIQSSFGNIDVSIDAQIREILRGLLGDN